MSIPTTRKTINIVHPYLLSKPTSAALPINRGSRIIQSDYQPLTAYAMAQQKVTPVANTPPPVATPFQPEDWQEADFIRALASLERLQTQVFTISLKSHPPS